MNCSPKCLRDSRIIEEERIIFLIPKPTPIQHQMSVSERKRHVGHGNVRRISPQVKSPVQEVLQRITFLNEHLKPSWEIRRRFPRAPRYIFDPSALHLAVLSGD